MHYLAPVGGVAQHKVAEAEVASHGIAKVYGEFLRVLVKEYSGEIIACAAVFALGRLHDNRQVAVVLPDVACQAQAGLGVLHTFAHE